MLHLLSVGAFMNMLLWIMNHDTMVGLIILW